MKESEFIDLLKKRLKVVTFNRQIEREEKALAAVLVPIISYPDQFTIILTQRTKHLKNHPGQISFPGGGYEEKDLHLQTTALRETFEEIGIAENKITLLGELPQIQTLSGDGYLVTPYVGVIKPPVKFNINSDEVDDIFEIPLQYLLDLTHYRKENVIRKGKQHSYYVINYENRFIWGATASILHEFAVVMR